MSNEYDKNNIIANIIADNTDIGSDNDSSYSRTIYNRYDSIPTAEHNKKDTVKGNNNVDVTGTAVIYVNTSPIVNNFYTTTAAGTLSVYAVYQVSSTVSITSPTIQIPVIQGINFNKRVLIEDYTG